MKKHQILLLLLLIFLPLIGRGQHYQNIVNEFTACTNPGCIDGIRQKYKPLQAFYPVQKEATTTLSRYEFDFSWAYGKKEDNTKKHFRLSLLLEGEEILFGQLEQLSNEWALETTLLFRNKAARIEELLQQHNKQAKNPLQYRDLISATTIRFPFFWQKL